MDGIWTELFLKWSLSVWADVLTVLGFFASIGSLIVSLVVKSEVTKLRASYIFDKRIPQHIKALAELAHLLNSHLINYNNSRDLIKVELAKSKAELEDLESKLEKSQNLKVKSLIKYIERIDGKPFVLRISNQIIGEAGIRKFFRRFYETNFDDLYQVYVRMNEIIRQLENLKLNKKYTL